MFEDGEERKQCSRCDGWKLWAEFTPSRRSSTSRRDWCLECHRRRANERRATPEGRARYRDLALRRKYGITLAQYEAMLERQSGRCGICRSVDPGGTPIKAGKHAPVFCVDHNHSTGEVRRLLCHRCNTALGMADEDPGRLREMANYIERESRLAHFRSLAKLGLNEMRWVARKHRSA